MKSLSVLICDTDEAYTKALVRYLLGCRKGFDITYYTSLDHFSEGEGTYQVALMTREFLEAEEGKSESARKIQHKIQLCNGHETGYKNYESLYKFQSMDAFCQRLQSVRWKGDGPRVHSNVMTYGIYSTIRHELLLPFALVSAKLMSETRRVLLVDLEANSMLYPLIHREQRMSVLDAIYELEVKEDRFRLEDYLDSYEGYAILGPVLHPTDLMGIRAEQWMRLLAQMKQTNFDAVIFLFGEMPQGFEYFVDALDQMTVLEKAGEYFRRNQEQFVEFLREENDQLRIEEVVLPMSSRGIPEGGYRMEELLQGKLGVFLKDLMAKRARVGV